MMTRGGENTCGYRAKLGGAADHTEIIRILEG
jgi:hypothetical protein